MQQSSPGLPAVPKWKRIEHWLTWKQQNQPPTAAVITDMHLWHYIYMHYSIQYNNIFIVHSCAIIPLILYINTYAIHINSRVVGVV